MNDDLPFSLVEYESGSVLDQSASLSRARDRRSDLRLNGEHRALAIVRSLPWGATDLSHRKQPFDLNEY